MYRIGNLAASLLFIWLIRTLLPAFMRLVTNLYHKAKEGKHYAKSIMG